MTIIGKMKRPVEIDYKDLKEGDTFELARTRHKFEFIGFDEKLSNTFYFAKNLRSEKVTKISIIAKIHAYTVKEK